MGRTPGEDQHCLHPQPRPTQSHTPHQARRVPPSKLGSTFHLLESAHSNEAQSRAWEEGLLAKSWGPQSYLPGPATPAHDESCVF
eukprot:8886278-Pyramimonas_sp.AAC.1